jgi:hypothetical protein
LAHAPLGSALEEIYEQTRGHPYFLQEWGYRAWNLAPDDGIDIKVAREATRLALNELDHQFFRVRFDRVTPAEREYMRALAELGEGVHRSAEVAELIGKTTNQLGPVLMLSSGKAWCTARPMAISPSLSHYSISLCEGR